MRLPFYASLWLLTSCSLVSPSADSGIRVLGVAQDGGRPQLGCTKTCCTDSQEPKRVVALQVAYAGHWVLVDATPDMAAQIRETGSLPSAIVLTHAHIGHYTGLIHLGREVMSADHMPVWCSARMASFLRDNGPWSQLVELGNIELHVFKDEVAFTPIPGIIFRPYSVPHREEFSDTFGFSIEVNGFKTLFIPDIDAWQPWGQLERLASVHDVAILDATFFDDSELPGRDMSVIPHPRVPSTMALLRPLVHRKALRVLFTHLNHTNPLWVKDSEEAILVRSQGFEIAQRGMWITGASLRGQKQP